MRTGCLQKLRKLGEEPRLKAIKLLSEVWGIGKTNANKLYNYGIQTIEDLRNNQTSLNANQKVVNIYYYT